jgi:hypothetical protein
MPANYVLLERIELNASAASVTFSNIPQSGYTDLKVVVSARSDFSATRTNLTLDFNGLTTNRSYRNVRGFDSNSVSSVSASNSIIGYIPAATATSSKPLRADSAARKRLNTSTPSSTVSPAGIRAFSVEQ